MCMVAGAALVILLGALAVIIGLWRLRSGRVSAVGVATAVSAICLATLLGFFARWGVFGSDTAVLMSLAEPTPRSLTLLALSILWSLAALWLLMVGWRKTGALRWFACAVAAVHIVIAGYLASFEFLPLVTWT